MKSVIYTLIIFTVFFYGCSKDNKVLKKIYEADQADRLTKNPDWNRIIKNDKIRICQAELLVAENKVHTSNDYFRIAMIFQHGNDSTAYKLARDLSEKAVMLDNKNTIAKWLMAASHDRYLLSKNMPQVYGTQYLTIEKNYYLRKIDTTQVSNLKRKEFGVRTIPEIIKFLNEQNGRDVGLYIEPDSLNVKIR